jgi:hypothetical protein
MIRCFRLVYRILRTTKTQIKHSIYIWPSLIRAILITSSELF